MCVYPQTCQIGLNFANEEEARRFKTAANEILNKKGRKTGKYSESVCFCPF